MTRVFASVLKYRNLNLCYIILNAVNNILIDSHFINSCISLIETSSFRSSKWNLADGAGFGNASAGSVSRDVLEVTKEAGYFHTVLKNPEKS